jgi:hypothetical protein
MMADLVVVMAVGGIMENVTETMEIMVVIADHEMASSYGQPCQSS